MRELTSIVQFVPLYHLVSPVNTIVLMQGLKLHVVRAKTHRMELLRLPLLEYLPGVYIEMTDLVDE